MLLIYSVIDELSFLFKCSLGQPHDLQLCFTSALVTTFVYGSLMLSLLMVSIDRFWAVRYPFSYRARTGTISKVMSIAPWLITFIIVIVEFVVHMPDESTVDVDCSTLTIISFEKLIENSLITIAVCVTMVVLYSLIIKTIVHQVCRCFSLPSN